MLSTENSGALTGVPAGYDPNKVYAKFSVTTFVKSLGRNSKKDEVVEISKEDARQLFPWGKARRATDEEISNLTSEISEEVAESAEVEVSAEVENEASVENDAPDEVVTESQSSEVAESEVKSKGGRKRR